MWISSSARCARLERQLARVPRSVGSGRPLSTAVDRSRRPARLDALAPAADPSLKLSSCAWLERQTARVPWHAGARRALSTSVEQPGLGELARSPDPARRELSHEYFMGGSPIFARHLVHGGSLQVTAHASCEAEAPRGSPKGTRQEWRVLRFVPAEGTTDLVQSVVKVCIGPPGCEPQEWIRAEAMALDYTKTFASVVLSALTVLGAPVLPEAAATAPEPLRILCIGLGGGTLPSFFAQKLANCEVDVVELERPVVEAATKAMGFVPSPRLRVSVDDGVAFALRASVGAEGGSRPYDAVVVDAYDAAGNVPAELWSKGGGLARALSQGLLKERGGLVAANFLPCVDLAPKLKAYRSALAERGAGVGFSVQAEGTGNRIAVQTCGELASFSSLFELGFSLARAGMKVGEATQCPFDMASLAARNISEWPE